MENNIIQFRKNYRDQLQKVLNQYRPKMDDINELWWAVNVRLPEHPRNSYYYHLNLAMAEKRLKELM